MKCSWLVGVMAALCLATARLVAAATCAGDQPRLPSAVAIPALRVQAHVGNAHAQEQLALAYLAGIGVPRDPAQAAHWLTRSAAGGSLEGQYLLGKSEVLHGKPDTDFRPAAALLRQVVQGGCIPAQFYLGLLTLHGKGVPKNVPKGVQMITTAAKAGVPSAQVWLGSMLITGQDGPKDPKAGFTWIRRAARTGSSMGEIFLAQLYLAGTGTPPHPVRARRLLESVYAKRDRDAPAVAYVLGRMYMEGKGVPANPAQAFRWMAIAANAHVSDSVHRFQVLLAELPQYTLTSACPLYRDPQFATDGAPVHLRVPRGQTVAVLSRHPPEIYAARERQLGFVAPSCLAVGPGAPRIPKK